MFGHHKNYGLTRRTATVCAIATASLLVGAVCEMPNSALVREIEFPIDGPSRFTNTFGDPRSGGRIHLGTDIFAAKGTPIVAPESGVVSWISHNSGSAGNAVGVTTKSGWTHKVMHLNNDSPGTDDGRNIASQAFGKGIKQGAKVKRGQIIGFVGDSGNAEGTSPHVHYEMLRPDGVHVDAGWTLVMANGSPYEGVFSEQG